MNSRFVIAFVTVFGLLAGACGQPVSGPRQAATPMPTAAEPVTATPLPAAAKPCPVTRPGQVALPPELHEAVRQNRIFGSGERGEQMLGSGPLWVSGLPPDGTLRLTPQAGALSAKIPWWRTRLGALHIEGRRLDAPAPPLGVSEQDTYAAGLLPNSLTFPTEGCWEVVGRFDGRDFDGQPLRAELRVVLRVVRGTADGQDAPASRQAFFHG